MDWQTIATAPKGDGTAVLLHLSGGEMHVGYWSYYPDDPEAGWWRDTIEGGDISRRGSGEPTHWMPLPEPPV